MAEIGSGKPFGSSPKVSGNSRIKKIIFWFLLLLLIVGGAVFALKRFGFFGTSAGPTVAAPVSIVDKNPQSAEPIVAPPQAPVGSGAPYQSEHFRVGEIAIGGEASLMLPESDITPLGISSVRGEAFPDKTKNNSKLIITWETSKPSKSEISYGKSVGQAEGVITEDVFGVSHSVVIPDLAQSSTYIYVISSKDQFGNEVSSDPYAVYTGAKEVSLFELIAGAVGEVFGWAMNK